MPPERPRGRRSGLASLGATPRLTDYLADLWAHRELARTLALNDFRNRNSGTILGAGWNLLSPLLLLGVYWFVFGVVLAGRRPDNFLAFLAVGFFLFQFIQRSAKEGSGSLLKGQGLIRSVHFPRAVLPLSEVVRNALGFLWELPVVLFIVLAVTREAPRPGWAVFLLVIVPMATLFASGLTLILARMATVIGDIRKLIPILFRVLFYLSGILFPVRAFVDDNPLLEYLVLNPIYAFVTLARHYTLEPEPGILTLWLSAAAWTFGIAIVGTFFFSRAEHRYGGA